MIVKHFKLSQPEKDRLIRIKARTGIQNWNVLCRWALCWSLAEPSVPGGVDPLSDSNGEMDWSTFAGEYSEIYEAIIRQRCINDGLRVICRSPYKSISRITNICIIYKKEKRDLFNIF